MLIEMQKQRRDWGVSILHCEGSLVPGPEMGYLAAKLGEIEGLQFHKLLIDFEHVAAIGSAGVTFIVGVYLSVTRQPVTRQRGGRIVLTGVNGCVRHVLDLTRLTTLIPLASDLASGLAMLRAAAPPTYKGCLNLAIGERSLQQLLVGESFCSGLRMLSRRARNYSNYNPQPSFRFSLARRSDSSADRGQRVGATVPKRCPEPD